VSADGKPYKETPWKLSEGVAAITWNYKYKHDLFYILPYHHLEFPDTIKKLILIDVDLEFRTDFYDLFQQFKKFSPTEVIGCGVTQSPFYFTFFKYYKKLNPNTHIGQAGRYQGLNTGVLLLDLEKMRASQSYQKTTQPATITELKDKYKFLGTVGDQDWLTLVTLLIFSYFLKEKSS
jgi:lipopolysaccharide biosynthesis glycosyltransferase